MTIKEAIDLLEEMHFNCLLPTSTDPKRFEKAEAIRIATKQLAFYGWHDLRKNPNDLPDIGNDGYVPVLITKKYPSTPEYCEYGVIDGYGCFFLGVDSENIVAWRYIELFEEE